MRFRRTLIFIFFILSAVAVWDVTHSGPEDWVDLFAQDLVRIRVQQDRAPTREPDFQVDRALEALTGVDRVAIDDFSGNLEVTRSQTEELTASYSILLWGNGSTERLAETADSLARQLSLAWVREGNAGRLTVEQPSQLPAGIRAMRLTVRLALPHGVALEARHTGDAHVEDLGGPVHLRHSGGQVAVRRVQGPVEIASTFGRVHVTGVEGPVRVELMGGDLQVWDVAGPVEGSVRLGALDLRGVTGDVTFSIHQGASRVVDVGGSLRLNGGYGAMSVAQVAGSVEVEQSFGALRLQGVTRAADVTVRFGELDLTLEGDGGWRVEAVVEMGALETDLDLQRQTSERRTTLSGVIGDGAHPLRVRVEQGEARISRR